MEILASGSNVSQVSLSNQYEKTEAVKRAHPDINGKQPGAGESARVNESSLPTVNTQGQSVGRLINVTA